MSRTIRGADRRESERFEILGRLRGTAVCDQRVLLRNIGPGGAAIESHWPLPLDARVALKVASGVCDTRIDARVRQVTRLEPEGYLVHLEFLGQDATLHDQLSHLLALPD